MSVPENKPAEVPEDKLVEALAEKVRGLLRAPPEGPRALLIGGAPEPPLGYRCVAEAPYEAVIVGSLSYNELLFFRKEPVFSALAQGIPVYLWLPGLPHRAAPCRSRALASRLAAAERELRNLGVLPLEPGKKHRILTGEEARRIRDSGGGVPAGVRLSPLAQDILGGREAGL